MNNKIYGNKELHELFTRQINSDSLCHSYLFYGKKGIGKKTFCRYIAKAILCKGKNKPCNNCSSCKKFDSDNHPDIYILEAKDAKNAIHIDEIRSIRQDAYITPNESQYKIYIIPNVENMSIGAFNALLKVLEEPPKTAMFLLTATSKSAVAETILSRCLSYSLYALSDDECITAVSELFPDIDEQKRITVSLNSDGILGKAIESLTSEDGESIEKLRDTVLKGIVDVNEYAVLSALCDIKSDRQQFNRLIDELVTTIRAGVLFKLSAKTQATKLQQSLAYSLTVDKCEKLVEILQRAVMMNDGNASIGLLTNWLTTNIFSIL